MTSLSPEHDHVHDERRNVQNDKNSFQRDDKTSHFGKHILVSLLESPFTLANSRQQRTLEAEFESAIENDDRRVATSTR